jgi:hypothetical protein
MPLFFFRVSDGKGTCDNLVLELPSDKAARDEACRLVKAAAGTEADAEPHTKVEVEDDHGRNITVVSAP